MIHQQSGKENLQAHKVVAGEMKLEKSYKTVSVFEELCYKHSI